MEEGVSLECLTTPVRLEGENGRAARLVWSRNVLGKPDASEWAVPGDNNGQEGFAALNALGGGDGFEFIEVRMTFILPVSVGPFDPGAYLDDWTIRFTHDN